MKQLRLAIDFDDTIVESLYPNIGELRKDAKEIINKLYEEGHYIIINTCRAEDYELMAEQFLNQHQIHFHKMNANRAQDILFFGMDCRKISADVYIDDKNLMSLISGMPPWKEIYKFINILAR